MKKEAQRLASPDGRATKPLNHKHVPFLFYNSNWTEESLKYKPWLFFKAYASQYTHIPCILLANKICIFFVLSTLSMISEAPSHCCQGLTKWSNVALYSVAAAFSFMSVKSLVSQDSHYIAQIILEKASFRRQNLTLPKPIILIKSSNFCIVTDFRIVFPRNSNIVDWNKRSLLYPMMIPLKMMLM